MKHRTYSAASLTPTTPFPRPSQPPPSPTPRTAAAAAAGPPRARRPRERQLPTLRARQQLERAIEHQIRTVALGGGQRVEAAQRAQMADPVLHVALAGPALVGEQAGDAAPRLGAR